MPSPFEVMMREQWAAMNAYADMMMHGPLPPVPVPAVAMPWRPEPVPSPRPAIPANLPAFAASSDAQKGGRALDAATSGAENAPEARDVAAVVKSPPLFEPCHVDGRPCTLDELVVPHMAEPRRRRLLDVLAPHAPCWHCPRKCERDARGLAGVHLGRRDREVLLKASPATASDGAEIATSSTSRAERVALLRATRKLTRLGLLEVGHIRQTQKNTSRVRTAWRSFFGDILADIYADDWKRGARVRWDGRVLAALRQVEHSPRDLLVEARASLNAEHERHRATWPLHGLRLRAGGDPAALYASIEHVDGLRAVLAAVDEALALLPTSPDRAEPDPTVAVPASLEDGTADAFEGKPRAHEPAADVLAESLAGME